MGKSKRIETQGVDLIELVIERVKADPKAIAGFCGDSPLPNPRPLPPEILDELTFPSGKPLPPSLRRWLAFDASWLESFGWFKDGEPGVFAPRSINEIVAAEFDEPLSAEFPHISGVWGEMYEPLADLCGECFLLPGGSDSRRIYSVAGEPDALGEYPVLVIDTDDLPYAAVMYPGLDVFMSDEACIPGATFDFDTYESLSEDKRYVSRIQHHANARFGGEIGIEIGDPAWGGLLEDLGDSGDLDRE
jgi:hypothetical protein